MSKSLLQYTLTFIIAVLAQVMVFNHICLFGVAVPLVFIYLLVKLPINLNVKWVLTIGFFLGLTIDIFSDTQGVNALACTLFAVLRKPLLKLYLPREDEMSFPVPSIRSLGMEVYLKYLFTLCLVYCTLFFLIESFSFFNFWRLIVKILSSTILTFALIVAVDFLTMRRSEKRL